MWTTRTLTSVLAVVVLFGCANDDPAADDELEATREAQAALADRLDRVEQQLEATGDESPDDDVDDLAARVDESIALLDEFREELEADRLARLDFAELVDDVESDLRGSLADLRDELQTVRAEIADLEIRYEVLQERIDRLQ